MAMHRLPDSRASRLSSIIGERNDFDGILKVDAPGGEKLQPLYKRKGRLQFRHEGIFPSNAHHSTMAGYGWACTMLHWAVLFSMLFALHIRADHHGNCAASGENCTPTDDTGLAGMSCCMAVQIARSITRGSSPAPITIVCAWQVIC